MEGEEDSIRITQTFEQVTVRCWYLKDLYNVLLFLAEESAIQTSWINYSLWKMGGSELEYTIIGLEGLCYLYKEVLSVDDPDT